MKANLKHELRTPLNHIIGYCELMLEEAADRGGARVDADLRRIHAGGTRLLALFDDLFDDRDMAWPPDRTLVNHQVRTLLREIIGDVEMLQEEASAAEQPEAPVDLARIASAARELLRLVVEHRLHDSATDELSVASHTVATFERRDLPTQAGPKLSGALLLVDDDAANRDMLSRRLTRLGHRVTTAMNGREAIEALRRMPFDLMLLDIEMPEMDGYQVLRLLKSDPVLGGVPVIVLSASDDVQRVVHCIETGAEDYLPKPFDPVLLQARITACLEKKQLRDREQLHLRQIRAEQDNVERLLLNILPRAIADRLKQGELKIADSFSEATVLFGDLVGFTSLAAEMPPADVVEQLNVIFSAFDQAVADLGLEKIKTIGDSYMAVGGLPVPRPDHAEATADLALRMQREVVRFNARAGTSLQVRIGVHLGPVVAGIIGRHKYAYDLWGDVVNIASRMESHSVPGRIQVTPAVEERLRGRYSFEPRGPIAVKGIGEMSTFFLVGRSSGS